VAANAGRMMIKMIGSSIPYFANEMFICRDCGRNLGDRYSRLKGKKQPDIIIINDKHYCSKCADKHYNEVNFKIK